MNKKTALLLIITVIIFGLFVVLPPLYSRVQAVSWSSDIPLHPETTPLTDFGNVVKFPMDNNPSEYQTEVGLLKTYALKSSASPQSILEWYKNNLPNYGWTVISEEDFPEFSKYLRQLRQNSPLLVYGEYWYSFWKIESGKCRTLTVSFMSPTDSSAVLLLDLYTNKPCPETSTNCVLSEEEKSQRQEIIKRLKEKFRLSIYDSDLCEKEEICGDNSPWNINDLLEMEMALEKYPDCFSKKFEVNKIRGMRQLKWILEGSDESFCCKVREGMPQEEKSSGSYIPYEPVILICDKNYSKRYTLKYVLTHELTHSFQYYGVRVLPFCIKNPLCAGVAYTNPIVISWLKETGWSQDGRCLPYLGCPGVTIKPPPDLPTEYAGINPLEDMAESVALYVTDPDKLLEISPRRYNFIRDNIMCGTEYHE